MAHTKRTLSDPRIQRGIYFIALNDDPGSSGSLDLETVRGYTTVIMLSEMCGLRALTIARHVIKIRREQE